MEIIERKGIGHPDTIADNLSEELSNQLIKEYLKEYGKVMHYNVDKVLVTSVDNEYIQAIFAGQYTCLKDNHKIDYILNKVCTKILGFIGKKRKLAIANYLNEGSPDLNENFKKKGCNDTSFAVGNPYTKAECLVLKLGEWLDNLHISNKQVGWDNKIMYIDGEWIIALAFVKGQYDYFKEKEKIKKQIKKKFKIDVEINTADTKKTQFITETGTSLECGDSGMTGRGNRRNGLITPCRPMTMEAYYGKNSKTHIGRIYQDWALKKAINKNKSYIFVNKIGNDIYKPEVFELGDNN